MRVRVKFGPQTLHPSACAGCLRWRHRCRVAEWILVGVGVYMVCLVLALLAVLRSM